MGEVIGRGGMSTVYRAVDTVLDRTVAVKVLLPALAEGDTSHVARFQREARAAGSLRHAAVVKIYDTGVDGESHYIVMEYVAGRRLDEVIRSKRLRTAEAARISAQVADAVAAAHAAGILHRDIKPANVMVDPAGDVKVLDFGIARTVKETTITQTTSAIGTASYMSPERVLGGPGDERSDIYAIGCLLYTLLTGRPPFTGDSAIAVMHQQVNAQPRPLAKAGARVPPGLDRLVTKMLAKDPAERPGTAAGVAGLLSLAAGAAPAALPATDPGAGSAAGVTAGAAPRVVPARPRSRRRRGLSVAALALAAAMVAAVVALVTPGGSAAKPAGRDLGITVARVDARIGRSQASAKVARQASAIPRLSGPASAGTPDPPSAVKGGTPAAPGPVTSPPQPPQPSSSGPGQRPGWAGPGHGRHLGWQKHGGQQVWGGDGGDGGGD
jgi:eukaryotic-like serine/threonine-protein kinase